MFECSDGKPKFKDLPAKASRSRSCHFYVSASHGSRNSNKFDYRVCVSTAKGWWWTLAHLARSCDRVSSSW